MGKKLRRERKKKVYETPETKCPVCDHPINRASEYRGRGTPAPGDATICIQCAAVLKFDNELKPIPFGDSELIQFALSQPAEFEQFMQLKKTIEQLPKEK